MLFHDASISTYTVLYVFILLLGGCARDEEPLVDGWVNWSWCKMLALWNWWQLVRADTSLAGMLNSRVGDGHISWVGLASDKLLPSFRALTNNVGSVPMNISICLISVAAEDLTSCSCTRQ